MAPRTLRPHAPLGHKPAQPVAATLRNSLPRGLNQIRKRWWAPLAMISLVLLVARILYLQYFSPYGLAPDEAQYWSWLANPDFSYLTKPPLTTWVMGLSTTLFGNTLLGVKLFALLSQSLVPLLGAAVARQLVPATHHKAAASWWAFALLTAVPLVAAGGLIMAPDVLLLPLWLAALLVVAQAINASASGAAGEDLRWPRWLLLGGLVGLAGLAKYTAVLFFPLLLVFALIWQRSWVKAPQPYVAGLIALLLQAPVIYWNATNGWAGFHHVLWQAEGDNRHGGLATLADFLGSQLLVLGPLGFVLILLAWLAYVRAWRNIPPIVALVVVFTLPIFMAFLLQTFNAKVQANWPLLGTVPALALAPAWLAQGPIPHWKIARWKMALVMVGLGLSTLLSLALYNTQVLRPLIPLKTDPTKDLQGWPEMGVLLGGVLQRLENPLVLGVRYQTLAPLAFHTTPAAEWFYWNAEGRRATDYDDWLWPQSLPNRPVVLVKESADFPIHVTELFRDCRPWHNLAVEDARGDITRKLYTWLCWNYRTQGTTNSPPAP